MAKLCILSNENPLLRRALLWVFEKWFMKTSKKKFISKQIYLYVGSQTFWSFMKFYFAHFVKVCFVFKKQSLCLCSSVYTQNKTLPTLENEKKDNSKWNFRKNGRASWFSCGRLKISKNKITSLQGYKQVGNNKWFSKHEKNEFFLMSEENKTILELKKVEVE